MQTRWGIHAAVAAASLVGLAPSAARAEGAAETFLRAAALSYEAGDYKGALEACRDALGLGGLALETHAAVRRYEGAAALGRKKTRKEASGGIRIALALDPTAEAPPGSAPEVEEAFAAERAWWGERTAFGVTHAAPAARAGEAPVLEVGIAGDELGLVAGARVSWRVVAVGAGAGAGAWSEAPVVAREAGAPAMRVALPAEAAFPAAGGRLEYFIQMIDAKRSVVAEVGSAAMPRVLVAKPPAPVTAATGSLPAPPPAALSAPGTEAGARGKRGGGGGRWAVWVGLGAGVVAAGAAAVALALFLPARSATLDVSFVVQP